MGAISASIHQITELGGGGGGSPMNIHLCFCRRLLQWHTLAPRQPTCQQDAAFLCNILFFLHLNKDKNVVCFQATDRSKPHCSLNASVPWRQEEEAGAKACWS